MVKACSNTSIPFLYTFSYLLLLYPPIFSLILSPILSSILSPYPPIISLLILLSSLSLSFPNSPLLVLQVHEELGDTTRARDAMEEAIRHDPVDPSGRRWLAQYYRLGNEVRETRAHV